MQRILVQSPPFDQDDECQRQSDNHQVGAVVSFVGQVRGTDIASLTLEHYPGMTEQALRRIAQQADERWRLQGVTIIHRVGELNRGEPIVLVLTAAAHRQQAFAACAYIMDILKTQAPFWKKERKLDGSTHWVEAREEDAEAAAQWLSDG
jgi:molybdopterin synthase catalytic subunit